MSAPSLIAKLGIDEASFTRGLKASEAGMQQSQEKARLLGAEIALLEQKMATGKTDAMVQEHKALQNSLRQTQAEAAAAKLQLDRLNAVKPAPVSVAASAPDESARYEAYWRKLEEQERSARAHAAIAKGREAQPEVYGPPEAYGPPEPPKPTITAKINKADQYGVPVGVDARPVIKITKRSEESGEDDEEEGGKNGGSSGRANNAEASHSIRAIFSSLGAGAGILQSLQIELPRLLQSAGAGLGAMIGIELVPLIVNGIQNVLQAGAIERAKFGRELAGDGTGTKVSSDSSLRSRTAELKQAAQERLDASGGGEAGSESRFAAAQRGGKNLWRMLTGGQSVEDEAADKIAQLEQRRIDLSSELAKRKEAELDLDKRGGAEGEDAVAADREKLRLKNEIAAVNEDANLDATARSNMINSLREESRLRIQIKEAEAEQHNDQRAGKYNDLRIEHPDIIDTHGGDQYLNVNPSQRQTRTMRKALNGRDVAMEGESSLASRGLDTRDAHLASLEADGRVRDTAIAREMMSPEQRAAEDKADADRARAEQRVQYGNHTRDVATEGSAVHDADSPGGSMIPDADKTGGNAYDSPENASSWNKAFPSSKEAPTVPNRANEIQASAVSAGKGDKAGGFDDKGIIGAVNGLKDAITSAMTYQ